MTKFFIPRRVRIVDANMFIVSSAVAIWIVGIVLFQVSVVVRQLVDVRFRFKGLEFDLSVRGGELPVGTQPFRVPLGLSGRNLPIYFFGAPETTRSQALTQ